MTGASLPLALPQEVLNSVLLQQVKSQSQTPQLQELQQSTAQYISGATPPSQDSKKIESRSESIRTDELELQITSIQKKIQAITIENSNIQQQITATNEERAKMEARLRLESTEKKQLEDQLRDLKYKFKTLEDNYREIQGKLIRAEAKLSVKLAKLGDASSENIVRQLDEQDKELHLLREKLLSTENTLEEQIAEAESKLNDEISRASNRPKLVPSNNPVPPPSIVPPVQADVTQTTNDSEVNPFLAHITSSSSSSTNDQASSLFNSLLVSS